MATATVQYDLGNGWKEALHCLTSLGKSYKYVLHSGLNNLLDGISDVFSASFLALSFAPDFSLEWTPSCYLKLLHLWGFYPVWILSFLLKLPAQIKRLSHCLHLKGFSPVWIPSCFLKSSLLLKHLPHYSHLKAFSPVWTLPCLFKCPARIKHLPHCSHLKGFSPLWIISCCFKYPDW